MNAAHLREWSPSVDEAINAIEIHYIDQGIATENKLAALRTNIEIHLEN